MDYLHRQAAGRRSDDGVHHNRVGLVLGVEVRYASACTTVHEKTTDENYQSPSDHKGDVRRGELAVLALVVELEDVDDLVVGQFLGLWVVLLKPFDVGLALDLLHFVFLAVFLVHPHFFVDLVVYDQGLKLGVGPGD